MKQRKFIGVAVLSILILAMIAVLPDYLESRKDINRLVNRAKAAGAAVFIQFATSEEQAASANEVLKKFFENPTVNMQAGIYNAAENEEFVKRYGAPVPGYIIMDGDGNVAVAEAGVITIDALLAATKNLHMHE